MTRDKKVLYTLSSTVTAALLCIVLFANGGSRMLAAVWLTLSAIAVSLFIKKRTTLSIYKKTVLLLLMVGALLYLSIFYLSGIIFGYTKPTVPLSPLYFVQVVLPCIIIVIASEWVRYILIAQGRPFATACAYLTGMLSQVAAAGLTLDAITNLNTFMDLSALTLFPALTAGVLYTHVTARYGPWPCIAYRALTTITTYFMPLLPNAPDIFIAFATLLLPLLLFAFLRALYVPRRKRATERPYKRRIAHLGILGGMVIATAFIMLVSCQFRFGTVVIATESMTGELNVGDAIIYERYETQIITKGQVIIFKKNDTLTVHRVVDIERINGQNRYYTKGDANDERDAGFITDNEIVGVTDFKIAYVGYPALWMRRIFTIKS